MSTKSIVTKTNVVPLTLATEKATPPPFKQYGISPHIAARCEEIHAEQAECYKNIESLLDIIERKKIQIRDLEKLKIELVRTDLRGFDATITADAKLDIAANYCTATVF